MQDYELIQRILAIEHEQALRQAHNKLSFYNTGELVHYKQIEFHKSSKRNRWVFGGNRSGKTECGAVETVWFARGIHPYRKITSATLGWVVSLSQQVQRDVAQLKVLNYLNPEWIIDIAMLSGKKDYPQNGIIDYITIKNVFGTVSRIGFKSCDQGREKFQGTSLDYVWFDEEPPEEIYKECRMRVLDTKGDIWSTMTPLKGLTWVYDEIYLNSKADNEVWHINMEWADNPYLDKDEISALTSSMSEEELESRKYGRFMSGTGLVYTEFDEQIHVIEPFTVPREWYDNISIDPGLNNPLSAHWYAVNGDGVVYVIAEHYTAGKDIAYHASIIHNICDNLEWQRDSGGRICALIDSAATQRTLASTKSVVELFYDYGILVNPRVKKDMFSGIQRVKSYLKNANGVVKLYIFKTCTNLIREIKSYWWGDGDIPKKKDDHSLDELRYYIMDKPEAYKQKAELTVIQKDKQKLIRQLKRKQIT
ncbi:MAG: terminase family protein [Clostridia bacterium]